MWWLAGCAVALFCATVLYTLVVIGDETRYERINNGDDDRG